MTNLFFTQFTATNRISPPKLRACLIDIEEQEGLSKGVDRYALLTLIKRVGKSFGFSPRMIQLLDYYMSFTRECDWQQGARPVVFQSVSKTALDFGLSERQIQKLEKALFEIGALSWNDSGNHRRYGQRDSKTGELLYAFGVDLSPLAELQSHLLEKLEEKQLFERAWHEAKRKISWYRCQIRAMISEVSSRAGAEFCNDAQVSYDNISGPIRAYMDLSTLRSMVQDHKGLYEQLVSRFQTIEIIGLFNSLSQISSHKDEQMFAHIETTNQPQTDKSVQGKPSRTDCFQGNVQQGPVDQSDSEGVEETDHNPAISSGLQHITLKQVHLAASAKFLDHLFMSGNRENWSGIIDAAFSLRSDLGISQSAWIEACSVLGRTGAAVCILITDRHSQRKIDPVRQPGGYFFGMIRKARQGELRLHASIFGILERGNSRNKSPLSHERGHPN